VSAKPALHVHEFGVGAPTTSALLSLHDKHCILADPEQVAQLLWQTAWQFKDPTPKLRSLYPVWH
jgi:hypothetical protein